MNKPILIVEGHGDVSAVPKLLREYVHSFQVYDFQPKGTPIRCGDVSKLEREGELERYIKLAAYRGGGDSILLMLDCEDACPSDVARRFSKRVEKLATDFGKPVAIVLFKMEFETLFLHCVEEIASSREVNISKKQLPTAEQREEKRDAKGQVAKILGVKYKESRDQPRYVDDLSWEKLRNVSRAFCHFEAVIEWLRNWCSGACG